MSTPATVPMFAPDGTLGDIPADRVQDALSRGFKQGVNVISQDGQSGVIPADRLSDATKQGMMPEGASTPRKPMDDRTGLQRFLDSAGIPRQMGSMSDVGNAIKNLIAPQASPTDPGFGQTLPVIGPAFRAQRELYDQPGVAAKAYGSLPFVGPPGYRAGQQLQAGDYAGAAGSGLNIITQLLGMKPTNLAQNIGNATQEAGNIAVNQAPNVGKAARAATVAGAAADAIHRGSLQGAVGDAIFSLLNKRAGETAEAASNATGQFLQRVGSSINPDVPAQFGNPAFSSASLQNATTPVQRNAPIRGGSQTVETFTGSTPEEIRANVERIMANRTARQQMTAPDVTQAVTPQSAAAPQAQPTTQTPSGTPPSQRALSGESALRMILTGQDNANLMRIAKSRGIGVSQEAQLKPGIADKLLVEKIINDFSPDELDNVASQFTENSRFGHDFSSLSPESYKALGINTYFPDVKLPAAMVKRVNAEIAAARATQQPKPAIPPAVMAQAAAAGATIPQDLTDVLQRSIQAARAKK